MIDSKITDKVTRSSVIGMNDHASMKNGICHKLRLVDGLDPAAVEHDMGNKI